MLLLLSQGVIPKQDEVGQQDEKRLLGNIQTDIVTIDKPCPQFPNLQTPKPGDWAHLNVSALATGAGSPWHILVPRAGSLRYILVTRAGNLSTLL